MVKCLLHKRKGSVWIPRTIETWVQWYMSNPSYELSCVHTCSPKVPCSLYPVLWFSLYVKHSFPLLRILQKLHTVKVTSSKRISQLFLSIFRRSQTRNYLKLSTSLMEALTILPEASVLKSKILLSLLKLEVQAFCSGGTEEG